MPVEISVIVPVYNVEKYLSHCIDTILSQTFLNYELILVDDGSTDNSGRICDEYAMKDDRIRVIHQENKGVSAARNTGLSEANGEWIAFIDSDDWVAVNYLECLLKTAEEQNVSVAVCENESIYSLPDSYITVINDSRNDIVRLSSREAIYNYMCKYLVWGKIYKQSLIHQMKFPEGVSSGEDLIFNLLLFNSHPEISIALLKEKLYFYNNTNVNSITYIKKAYAEYERSHWLLNYVKTNDTKDLANKVLLLEGFKGFWAYRYAMMYTGERTEECHILLEQCMVELKKNSFFSLKERIYIFVFTRIPQCYRLFRLMEDKTLVNWERQQRQQLRQRRKAKV